MTSPTYFTSAIRFMSDASAARGDYTCVVCESGTTQTDTVAISYDTGRAHFSHVACLTSAGIAVSDDARARQKAQHKAKAAVKAAKSLSKAETAPARAQTPPAPIAGGAPAPDETVPVDEAGLRAIIEAEYDELLGQAIDRLQTLSALIESLQTENRRLVAQNAVAALAPASAASETTEAAPEATPVKQNPKDKHLCRVCSKPARKDADTCKLHQFAAPADDRSKIGQTVEQIEQLAKATAPAEPVSMRPQTGTYDVTFVGMAPNDTMVRLHQSGVMQNQYDGPCSYLMADSGITQAFKRLTPGSTVRVTLTDKKVSAVSSEALKASTAA